MAGNISPRTVPASDQNISTGLWQRYEAIKGHQTTNNALMEVLQFSPSSNARILTHNRSYSSVTMF